MKKFSLLVLLFSSFNCLLLGEQKLITTKLKNGIEVDCVRLESSEDNDTFLRGKELFVRAFSEAYKKYTPEQLYLENKAGYLENFLAAAFEDEEHDFNTKKQGSVFVVARDVQSNKIIGFAAYDNTMNSSGRTVYIRQLAIDPARKQQGLGSFLVSDVIKVITQNESCTVTVCTRKINEPAIALYQKLNFQDAPMAEVHPELPAYKYRGFKLSLR